MYAMGVEWLAVQYRLLTGERILDMMTLEMMVKLRRSLTVHEGYKKFPYMDTATPPRITIGIGYNLSDRGVDDDWINNQYQQDVDYFYKQLCTFPWFEKLNTDRQIVLVDMCFMGWKKFLEFQGLINALAANNFQQAYKEMLNSEWARETHKRASDLAYAMLTGEYNI